MHLIDCDTLKLTWFPASPPPYAILSHTWGEEEVTFAQFNNASPSKYDLVGFRKIKWTCEQARRDGLRYAWVDTCCINKESSAELGEAINSMFQWYSDASVCYAYIQDLPSDAQLPIRDAAVFRGRRWFSRGWTLQELLAPREVVFFGPQWTVIGKKDDLATVLAEVTGIPPQVLKHEKPLQDFSVADRMSWAAKRQTTRTEDMAYCLMGIFDVNMPMIYGEGLKAFLRLQHKILKHTQDDSLFAWQASTESASTAPYRGLFARSPREFASDVSITSFHTSGSGSTNSVGGGRISLSCAVYEEDGKIFLGLRCWRGTDMSKVVGIQVMRSGSDGFLRCEPSSLFLKPMKQRPDFESVVVERFVERRDLPPVHDIYRRNALHLAKLPPEIVEVRCHPQMFPGSKEATPLPLHEIVDGRVLFELRVDIKATGIDLYRRSGPGRDPSIGNTHILIMVWVRSDLPSDSHEYVFKLVKTSAVGDPGDFFDSHPCPNKASEQQEVEVGWATISARGSFRIIHGHRMFNIDVEYGINEDLKAKWIQQDRVSRAARARHMTLEASIPPPGGLRDYLGGYM